MGLPKTLLMLCTRTHYSHVLQNQLGLPRKLPSLIDNIFCNGDIDDHRIFTGILYTNISDHFPILYIDHGTKAKQNEPFFSKIIYSQKTWIGLHRHYVTRTDLLYYPVKIPRGPIPCSLTNSRRYMKIYSHWSHINLGTKHGDLGWQRVLRTRLTEKTNCIFVNRRPTNQSMRGYIKKNRNKLNKLIHFAEQHYYEARLERTKTTSKGHGLFWKKNKFWVWEEMPSHAIASKWTTKLLQATKV